MSKDLLASWRDGPTKSAIVKFVDCVTTGPQAVAPDERVAVFDNDGTLWSEKPMPTQLHYLVQRWAAAIHDDPQLARVQPYTALAAGDLAWIGNAVDKHSAGDNTDLTLLLAAVGAATAGMSVEDYASSVVAFYRDAKHPTLDVPYAETVYQPMIELLSFLESRGFINYVVSAGERDFMRPMATENYGVPAERVIGSAMGLEYADGEVRYANALAFFDDGPEKPTRIWSRIGRRPLIAAGNSNGDREMLEYTPTGPRGLRLLIHHDDTTGRGDTSYEKGAEDILDEANDSNITVVSVQNDWNRVFRGPTEQI